MYTQYFKGKDFHRLFLAFRKKYESLGRWSGKVTLSHITATESKDLSCFFGYQIPEGTCATFSLEQFEKIMLQSKYENFSFPDLLEHYFKEPIYSKKEVSFYKKTKQDLFYQDLLVRIEGPGKKWLEKALEDKEYQLFFKRRYQKDSFSFRQEIIHVMDLLDQLPVFSNQRMTLPLFAGNITKNPHFLDRGTGGYHLFIRALSTYLEKPYPKDHSIELSYLLEVGITQDTLSNFVLTYGLDSSQNFVHFFYEKKETLILNLQNLSSIQLLYAPSRKVFIFENPSILEAFLVHKKEVAVVITSGNPNLALYEILDKLYQNHQFYYNGDFDPEGLLIASALKKRYPKLTLFGYREIDYEHCLSKESLSERRLSKLHVEDKDLQKIQECLLATKKAGYQEKNIEYLLSFVEKKEKA